MRKPKIFSPNRWQQHPFDYLVSGPPWRRSGGKARRGRRILAHNGDLLSVQFDDVEEMQDHQILEFDRHRVEITVNKGKISFSMLEAPKSARTERGQRRRSKKVA